MLPVAISLLIFETTPGSCKKEEKIVLSYRKKQKSKKPLARTKGFYISPDRDRDDCKIVQNRVPRGIFIRYASDRRAAM